jgi:hypothetical protein
MNASGGRAAEAYGAAIVGRKSIRGPRATPGGLRAPSFRGTGCDPENCRPSRARSQEPAPDELKTEEFARPLFGPRGRASFYSWAFGVKNMANGRPFDPDSKAAASKTLPLGMTKTQTPRRLRVARLTQFDLGHTALWERTKRYIPGMGRNSNISINRSAGCVKVRMIVQHLDCCNHRLTLHDGIPDDRAVAVGNRSRFDALAGLDRRTEVGDGAAVLLLPNSSTVPCLP